MILFGDYKFLYLLLAVPFILLGYGLLQWLRRRRVRRLGDPAMVEALMPSRSAVKGWVRVVFFCIAFGLFAIGMARPRTGAKLSERKSRGAEIIVALDVSNSMLAKDYSPNRLERAKLSISRLTDKLQDDRIGLVIFAGTSFVQLPVTTDYVSAKMFLGSIDTGSVPVQGTAIGDAIRLCIKSFSAQSEKSRVIIVISDGENHEDDAVEAAKLAAESGIKVYTIGVGSPEGQPIPMEGGLMKDKNGNIVVTRLNEDILKDVASAGGGAYIHAGTEEFGLNPIVQDIRKMEDEEFGSVVFEDFNELYMYFFGAALLFFVIEMLIGERKPRRKLFQV
ncbi:MAG: VWA domain-containing protein [Bacteroidales bacterium]|nr:VWA domain-containing protein [Bacteroidales bacterium]